MIKLLRDASCLNSLKGSRPVILPSLGLAPNTDGRATRNEKMNNSTRRLGRRESTVGNWDLQRNGWNFTGNMADKYDEDDLEDYANYSQDELDPEEEERLEALVPQVKAQLTEYTGYNDELIKDALWDAYSEVGTAVSALKKKLKKLPAPKPAVSKPNEGKPLSKISALAKARASQKSQSIESTKDRTSISILDKLKSNKPSTSSPLSSSTKSSKLSGLAALRTSRLTKKPLEVIKNEEKKAQPIKETVDEPSQASIPSPEPIISLSEVTYEGSPFPYNSNALCSTVILTSDTPTIPKTSYKRKLIDHHVTSVYYPNSNSIVKKIKSNFNKPSPDDVILNAQKSAFEAEKKQEEIFEKVATLKISKQATKPKNKIDLEGELAKRNTKPNTSFVVIGHVDAGKSTLTGRLLLDQNIVDKNTYIKLKREAEKAGKGSFSLAWVMDQTEEERNRGVTIDICTSQFETAKARFTIVDAPGHRDFVPNMITGVSQADIAVLVVDSSTDAFESGFNLDGQTKEHTILARSLGIQKIIVAVNKMDNNDWSEDRFEEIKSHLTEFLKITGYNNDQIEFVPCSGLTGVNISSSPTGGDNKKLSWYKGDSILAALEKSNKLDRDFNRDFIMSISDVDSSKSEFLGRIDAGTIQPGETVLFAPSGESGVVDSIVLNGEKVQVGIAGDNVTLKIKGIDTNEVLVGDIISIVSLEIASVSKFESRLVLFDLDRPLLVGTQFVLFRGNVQQPAKITKVIALLDKVTGEPLKKKPRHLSSHQSALVEIELINRPLPLQLFKDNKQLGRIVLRKDGRTIAAGAVEKF